MQTTQPTTHIRWMLRRDLPEMLDIERLCFDFPWREEDFIRELRKASIIGMTAERDERIVGYMLYELFPSRIALLNFAVRPSLHGEGIGRAMMEKLKGKLSLNRRHKITVKVRERNLEGQLFFKHMGFAAVDVLRDHYDDSPGEDAYLFEFCL